MDLSSAVSEDFICEDMGHNRVMDLTDVTPGGLGSCSGLSMQGSQCCIIYKGQVQVKDSLSPNGLQRMTCFSLAPDSLCCVSPSARSLFTSLTCVVLSIIYPWLLTWIVFTPPPPSDIIIPDLTCTAVTNPYQMNPLSANIN